MILQELKHVEANPELYTPKYLPVSSAWVGHGAFAMWLMKHLQPRVVVELGSHYGYSYFAFCQAVVEDKLPTKCYAVDTWQGDEHAGFYSERVYAAVTAENAKYAGFSTLLRKRFDQALPDIPDGSVDLLHVDGRHFYDDVKEDFESYIPKLSQRAVVLFHDVEVVDRNFGVKRYFAELMQKHKGFNFLHAHGLGVLFFGNQQTDFAKDLAAYVKDESHLAKIRSVFSNAPVPLSYRKTILGRIARKIRRMRARRAQK